MKISHVLRKFKYLLFGFLALLFTFQATACTFDLSTTPQVIEQPEDENDENKPDEGQN